MGRLGDTFVSTNTQLYRMQQLKYRIPSSSVFVFNQHLRSINYKDQCLHLPKGLRFPAADTSASFLTHQHSILSFLTNNNCSQDLYNLVSEATVYLSKQEMSIYLPQLSKISLTDSLFFQSIPRLWRISEPSSVSPSITACA